MISFSNDFIVQGMIAEGIYGLFRDSPWKPVSLSRSSPVPEVVAGSGTMQILTIMDGFQYSYTSHMNVWILRD